MKFFSSSKKILEYSLFVIISFICLIYLEKLSLNLSKFLDIKYLVLLLVILISIINFLNIKKIFNLFKKYILKLNSYSYKNISLLTISITVIFIITSIILTEQNITKNYFRKEHFFIIYAILKFNLFACLFLSLINTGYLLNYYFEKELTNTFDQQLTLSSKIILFLGFGVVILSTISIILGLIGVLYYKLILILISIIILFSKRVIDFIILRFEKNNNKNDFFLNFYNIIFFTSLAFLFLRILLPFREDGDIWGHYLNFYYSVSINNQIFDPNYWPHFAQLKGLGLNFLAISISDFFSAQLVSFIFIILIIQIIYDFGKDFKNSKILLGIITIVICSFGMTLDNDIDSISLSKPHIQFNFLYIFCTWLIFKFFNLKANIKTLFLISIPFFFTGFAHTLFSFIIFLTLSGLFLACLLIHKKFNKVLFYTLFGLCLGVITSLAINYIQFGMPEAALTNVFWEYSDQEKFKRIIGLKAISWPLIDNSDQIKNSLNYEFIKANFNNTLFTYSLSIFRSKISLLMYLGLILYLLVNKNYKYIFILVSLFGCFLTTMMVYYIFYSPSFTRSIFFINSILAIIFTTSLMIFLRYTNSFVNKSTEYLFILPTLFFLSFFVHKTFYKNQHFYKSLFIDGKSLEYNFLKCDDQHVDCMLFKFMNTVNKKYNYKKIYAISQHGGVGSTLPRPGIIVEPYFNTVHTLKNLQDLSNDDVAYEFLSNNIKYIIFDLKRSIQNPGNFISKDFVQNNLEVAESNNNIYLLKIKKNVEEKDYNFINLVDLKMSYITNYIFSDKFIKMSSNKSKKEVLNKIKKNTECLNDFNKELIYNIFETNIDLAMVDKDDINKIRYKILKAISLAYNLDDLRFYNKNDFKWTLTVLGNLTSELSNIQKFNIEKSYKKKCVFH